MHNLKCAQMHIIVPVQVVRIDGKVKRKMEEDGKVKN